MDEIIILVYFFLSYACSHGGQAGAESSDDNEEENPHNHKMLEQWEEKNKAEAVAMDTMEVDDETGQLITYTVPCLWELCLISESPAPTLPNILLHVKVTNTVQMTGAQA
ncbi:MAG: hypothetical protein MJE68_26295 [Proteobacteria bacterium]|nr:hypothetical protein [Pseudomonadota bacterium]